MATKAPLNAKRLLSGVSMDDAIQRVTKALSTEGFGVLTRIDMHLKMKEKLDKDMLPTVILGSCNPAMAYGAFQMCSDITSLIPCNVVVRVTGEEDGQQISVEVSLATAKMLLTGDDRLVELAKEADVKLERVLAAV